MRAGASSFVAAGAWLAAAAVGLGAFGAHGLRTTLAPEALEVYQTGVQYQFVHALGLIGVGLACTVWPASRWLRAAGALFIAGIVLFSGSLYALALTGVRGIGFATPFGGIAFILGWIAFGLAALRE